MRPLQPSVAATSHHPKPSTVRSSGMVNSMVLITVTGDHDRPEWLIRINGIRSKLFMGPRRRWLDDQPLAEHERSAVNRWLVALDAMEKELTAAEAAIASACLGDDRVRRLMTIGGINMAVAAGILSAIGDVSRFAAAEKLVSYLGLDPRVRQSGDRVAQHGRISKTGSLARARNAGGGSLGRSSHTGAAASLLRPGAGTQG